MTVFISGTGLGNFQTNPNQNLGMLNLGQQLQDQLRVNITNGNLSLGRSDTLMLGRLSQHQHLRTYNSRGLDDGQGAFIWGFDQRIILKSGNPHQKGSEVIRVSPDGFEQRFVYADGRYRSTDGSGVHDRLRFDSIAQRWLYAKDFASDVKITNGNSGERVWVYNTEGQLVAEHFRGEVVKSYSYDNAGRLIRVEDASGQTTHFLWQGELLTKVYVESDNDAAQATHYFYDGRNRLERVVVDLTPEDADDVINTHGNIQDDAIFETVYTYWGDSDRIASITDPGGQRINLQYQQINGDFVLQKMVDSTGYEVSFNFNFSGRITEVTTASGITRYSFDERGNVTQIERPDVGGERALESFVYDAQDNLERYTNAYGQTTVYDYNPDGNLEKKTDPLGFVTDYLYNSQFQLISETRYHQSSPTEQETVSFWYDANHDLRFSVTAEGRVTAYDYDNHLLVQTRTFDNAFSGSLSLSALDAFDLAEASNIATLTDFVRDWRGMVQSETQYAAIDEMGNGIVDAQTRQSTYTYDVHGQLLQKITGRSVATASTEIWDYDGLGRNTFYRNGEGEIQTTTYQDAQRKSSTTAANGVVNETQWDSRGFSTSSVLRPAGTSSLPAQETRFHYDEQGRLISQEAPGGQQSFYFYDDQGRKTAELGAGGELQTYYYVQGQRLEYSIRHYNAVTADVQVAGNALSHTLAELMPAVSEWDRRRDFRYDDLGRLDQETVAGRLQIDYVYEEDSARLLQTTNTDLTLNQSRQQRWLYDEDGLLIAEQDPDGFVTHHEYNGAGQLVLSQQYAIAVGLDADITNITNLNRDDDRTTRFYYNAQGDQVGVLNFQGVLTESQYKQDTRTRTDTAYQRFLTRTQQANSSFEELRAFASSDDDEITVSNFDKAGRLIESLNAQGLRSEYFYNSQGQLTLTRQTDTDTAEQRANQQFFDAFGRISAELNGRGSLLFSDSLDESAVAALIAQYGTRYQYDNNNRITQITDAKGQITRFWFDDKNRKQLSINHDGQISLTQMNAFGETVSTRDFFARVPAGMDLSIATDALFTQIEALADDPRDRVNQYRYDLFGNQRLRIDGEGYRHWTHHNGFSQVIETSSALVVDRSDRPDQVLMTRPFYDNRGNVREMRVLVNGRWEITETKTDAYGQLSSTRNALREIEAINYQQYGKRSVTYNTATRLYTIQHYDTQGRVVSVYETVGRGTATISYENFGKLIKTVSAEGITAETELNAFGQEVLTKDHYGSTLEYQYNELGLLDTTYRNGERWEKRSYNELGQLISLTTRPDSDNALTETYSYNAAGQRLTLTQSGNGVNRDESWDYNALGQLESHTNARDITTRYEHNRNDHLVKTTEEVGAERLRFTRLEVDSQGRILRSIIGSQNRQYGYERAEQERRFFYDSKGQLVRTEQDLKDTSSHSAESTLSTVTHYDALGRVVRTEDSATGTSYQFYRQGNLENIVIDAKGNLEHRFFDAQGQLIERRQYQQQFDVSTINARTSFYTVTNALADFNPEESSRQFFVYDRDGELLIDYTVGATVNHYQTNHDERMQITSTYRSTEDIDVSGTTADVQMRLRAFVDANFADFRRTSFFDTLGRVEFSINELSEVTHFSYDAADRLEAQRRFSNTHSGLLNRTSLANLATSARDEVQFFTYDALGRQKGTFQVVEQNNSAAGLALPIKVAYQINDYDGESNVTRIRSGETRMGEASIEAIKALSPLALEFNKNTEEVFTYDEANRLTNSENTLTGINSAQSYDMLDNVVTTTNGEGDNSYQLFNTAGQLRYSISSEGRVSENRYNDRGLLLQTIQYQNTITNPETANISSIIWYLNDDASDRIETYLYDEAGNLAIVIDSQGNATWTEAVDSHNNVVDARRFDRAFAPEAETGDSALAALTFEAASARLENLSADGQSREFYGHNGELKATLDGEGFLVYHDYNTLMQNTRSRAFAEPIEFADFQHLSDVENHVQNLENTVLEDIRRTYSTTGLLLEETIERGLIDETISWTYDALGRMLSETQKGHTNIVISNAAGQARFAINGLGFVTETRYHANGATAALIQYANAVDLSTIDASTFSLADITPNPSQDRFVVYTYNAQQQVELSYTSDGRLQQMTYNDNGQVLSVYSYHGKLPNGDVNAVSAVALQALKADTNNWLEDSRDFYGADGLLQYRLMNNGLLETYRYDGQGQLVSSQREGSLLLSLQSLTATTAAELEAVLPSSSGNSLNGLVANPNAPRKDQYFYNNLGELRFTINAAGYLSETIQLNAQTQINRQYDINMLFRMPPNDGWTVDALAALINSSIERIETIQILDDKGQARFFIDGDGFVQETQFNALGQVVKTLSYGQVKLQNEDRLNAIGMLTPRLSGDDWAAMDDDAFAAYLEQLRDEGVVDAQALDVASHQFYEYGRLKFAVNGRGAVSEYRYNAINQLESVIRYANLIDPSVLTTGSDIAKLVEPDALNDQVESYQYDALARLDIRTDYLGYRFQSQYNAFGELETQVDDIDGDARTNTVYYNRQGEVVAQETAIDVGQVQVEQNRYNDLGQLVEQIDGVGDSSRMIYNDNGELVLQIAAAGEVTRFTYNAFGEVMTQTQYAKRLDPSNLPDLSSDEAITATLIGLASGEDRVISYGYTALGQIHRQTNQQGFTTTTAFDAFGRVDHTNQQVDINRWLRSDFDYDKRGNTTQSIRDSFGEAITENNVFNAQGLLESTTNHRGVSRIVYDAAGQAISETDTSGATRTRGFDAFGRVISESDALLQTQSFHYNPQDNSVTVISAGGIETRTVFNAFGDSLIVIDGEGNETHYQYNQLGKLKTETDALGQEQSYTYNLRGQLNTVTDKAGRVTEYEYFIDADGRKQSETLIARNGERRTRTVEFNAFGEQSLKVDHFGEVEEQIFFNGGRTVQIVKDKNGRALNTRLEYNGQGQVVLQEVWQADQPESVTTTRFEYDKLGRLETEIKDPNGIAMTTRYRYNDDNQVVRSESDQYGVSLNSYNNQGLVHFQRRANGYLVENLYNANQQMTTQRQYLDTISEAEFELLLNGEFTLGDSHDTHSYFDADGRQIASRDPSGLLTFMEYNGNDQLVHQYKLNAADSATITANVASSFVADVNIWANAWSDYKLVLAWRGLGLNQTSSLINNPTIDEVDREQLDAALSAFVSGDLSLEEKAGLWLRMSPEASTLVSRSIIVDELGRSRFEISGNGTVSETRYDALDQVSEVIRYANLNLATLASDDITLAEIAAIEQASNFDQNIQHYYNDFNEKRFTIENDKVTEYIYDEATGQLARTIQYANRIDITNSFVPVELSAETIPGLLLASSDDRHQQVIYNDKRQAEFIIDPVGQVKKFSYNFQGQVETETTYRMQVDSKLEWTAQELQNALNSAFSASAVTQQVHTTVFDALGRKVFERDALGYLTHYLYTMLPEGGWSVETQRHPQTITRAELSDEAQRDAWFSSLGDELGEDYKQLYWLGVRKQTETYNSAGEKIKVTDALDNSELFQYNHRGQLTQYTNKNGHSEYSYYDDVGNLVATFSPTEVQYDQALIDFEAVDFGGLSANRGYLKTFSHDHMGRVIEERFYRSLQNINDIEAPSGDYDRKTYSHDKDGRVIETRVYTAENTLLQYEQLNYNAFGEVTSSIQGGNSSAQAETRFSYDKYGRLGQKTEAFGTSDAAITQYQYDDFDQSVKVTSPLGYEIAYSDLSWARKQREFLGFPRRLAELSNEQRQALRDLYSVEQSFDANGRKISQTNGLGETTETYFDAFGNTVLAVHPDGRKDFFFYNAANQLVLTVDTYGRGIEKRYDNIGNITHEISYGSRLSNIDTLTPEANVQTLIDELQEGPAQEKQFEYDVLGRKIRERDAAENWVSFAYDAIGQQIRSTNANGVETFYLYDGQGRKRAEQINDHADARALVTRFGYDAFNRTTSVEKAYRNQETSTGGGIDVTPAPIGGGIIGSIGLIDSTNNFNNSRLANLTIDSPDIIVLDPEFEDIENVNPLNFKRVENVRYNVLGQVVSSTNMQGQTVEFTYDLRGNLLTEKNSYGGIKHYYYNDLNQRIATVDEENYLSLFVLDKVGNQIQARSYETAITVTPTNHYQQPTAISGDRYREVSFVYDTQNRQVESITARDWQVMESGGFSKRAVTTSKSYDVRGNVLSETDGRGNTTHHYYDLMGNRVLTINPEGEITQFEYDDFNRLKYERSIHARYTPGLVLTDFEDLPIGRFKSQFANLSGGLNTQFSTPYNSATRPTKSALEGFISRQTSNEFITKSLTYDAMNRLTHIVILGTELSYFEGDHSGGLVIGGIPRLENGIGGVSLNSFNQSSSSAANNDDNVETVTANHVTKMIYDELGQLRKKEVYGFINLLGKQGATYATDYEYDDFGRLTAEVSPEFVGHNQQVLRKRTTMEYNALGQREILREGGINKMQEQVFQNGRLQSESGYQGKKSYGYDNNGNLDWVFIESLNRREFYFYNKKGEVTRTKIYDQKSLTTTATLLEEQTSRYNAFGQVTERGLNGNWHIYNRYDQLGRLIASNENGGVAQAFFYDSNNNRIMMLKSDGIDLANMSSDEIANLKPHDYEDHTLFLNYAKYDKNNRATTSGQVNVDIWQSRAVNWERRISSILSNPMSLDFNESQTSYDAFGRVKTQTDALGNTTTHYYDKRGNRVETHLPVVDVVHENGYTQKNVTPIRTYAFNAMGELIQETDANDNSTRYRYALGQRSELIFADDTKRRQEYDQYGELRATEEAGGKYRKNFYWSYNDRGDKTVLNNSRQVANVSYANSSTYWQTTTYNINNKVIENTREEDLTFNFNYQASKHGNVRRYEYDALGRLVRHEHRLTSIANGVTLVHQSSEETYQHDSLSAEALALDGGRGGVITTKRDFRGFSLEEHFTHFKKMLFQKDYWNHEFTWSYNLAGQLESVTSLEPQADTLSILSATRKIDFGGSLNSGLSQNMTSLINGLSHNGNESLGSSQSNLLLIPDDEDWDPTLPPPTTDPEESPYTNKNIQYRYDGFGQLTRVEDVTNRRISTYGYNDAGLRDFEQHQYGNTIHQSVKAEYDSHNRVIAYRRQHNSAPYFYIGFGYDAAGNVRRKSVVRPALAGYRSIASETFWYSYDNRNRMLISQGKLGFMDTVDVPTGLNGTTVERDKFVAGVGTSLTDNRYKIHQESGYKITYDDTGRRSSFSSTTLYVPFEYKQPGEWTDRTVKRRTEHYDYDNNGHLKSISLASNGSLIYARENDHWGRAFQEIEYNFENGNKFRTSWHKYNYLNQKEITRTEEHKKGRNKFTNTQFSYYNDSSLYTTESREWKAIADIEFGDDGVPEYDISSYWKFKSSRYYSYKAYGNSYKQRYIQTKNSDNKSARSAVRFDSNGDENSATDYNNSNDIREIRYYRNAEGQIIHRHTTPHRDNDNEFDFKHYYFYFNGKALGNIGNDGSTEGTFTNGLVAQLNKEQGGDPFAPNPSYNFDANMHYFTGSANSQFYRARGGESLSSLARSFMGDASLWYVIADANGIGYDAVLGSGQQILIPASFQGQQHTSESFKPFSSAETLRDFTPAVPPKDDNCKVVKIVVFIAITIAVSIATSGAASALFAGMSNAILAGVLSGVTGALAANAINQGVAIAMGLQDGFDFGSFAKDGIVGGITGGIGGAYKASAEAAKNAGKSAAAIHAASNSWGAVAGKALRIGLVSASADLIHTLVTEDKLTGRDFAMAGLSVAMSVGSAMAGRINFGQKHLDGGPPGLKVDASLSDLGAKAQQGGFGNFLKYGSLNAAYKATQSVVQEVITTSVYNALTNDPDEKRKLKFGKVAANAAKSAGKSLYSSAVSTVVDPIMEDLGNWMTRNVWQRNDNKKSQVVTEVVSSPYANKTSAPDSTLPNVASSGMDLIDPYGDIELGTPQDEVKTQTLVTTDGTTVVYERRSVNGQNLSEILGYSQENKPSRRQRQENIGAVLLGNENIDPSHIDPDSDIWVPVSITHSEDSKGSLRKLGKSYIRGYWQERTARTQRIAANQANYNSDGSLTDGAQEEINRINRGRNVDFVGDSNIYGAATDRVFINGNLVSSQSTVTNQENFQAYIESMKLQQAEEMAQFLGDGNMSLDTSSLASTQALAEFGMTTAAQVFDGVVSSRILQGSLITGTSSNGIIGQTMLANTVRATQEGIRNEFRAVDNFIASTLGLETNIADSNFAMAHSRELAESWLVMKAGATYENAYIDKNILFDVGTQVDVMSPELARNLNSSMALMHAGSAMELKYQNQQYEFAEQERLRLEEEGSFWNSGGGLLVLGGIALITTVATGGLAAGAWGTAGAALFTTMGVTSATTSIGAGIGLLAANGASKHLNGDGPLNNSEINRAAGYAMAATNMFDPKFLAGGALAYGVTGDVDKSLMWAGAAASITNKAFLTGTAATYAVTGDVEKSIEIGGLAATAHGLATSGKQLYTAKTGSKTPGLDAAIALSKTRVGGALAGAIARSPFAKSAQALTIRAAIGSVNSNPRGFSLNLGSLRSSVSKALGSIKTFNSEVDTFMYGPTGSRGALSAGSGLAKPIAALYVAGRKMVNGFRNNSHTVLQDRYRAERIGFRPEHIDAAGRLFGKALTDDDMGAFGRLWDEAYTAGQREGLTKSNSRERFNNQRRKFWELVYDDSNGTRGIIESAGFSFSKRGNAPTYRLVSPFTLKKGGERFDTSITIDHIVERQTAPGAALDASNLRFSLSRENTYLLRVHNAKDPFINSKLQDKLSWEPFSLKALDAYLAAEKAQE